MDTSSERLYCIRSWAGALTESNPYDRGTISTLKLLASEKTKRKLSQNYGGKNYVDAAEKQLRADGGFLSFFLTDVSFTLQEKMQVNTVLGDSEVVYYFGRNPVMATLSGLLFDGPDTDWFIQFMQAYNEILRGTQLAKNYQLIKFELPNMTLIGSVNSISYNQNSSRDTDIPFSMTLLVKEFIPKSNISPKKAIDGSLKDVFSLPKGDFMDFNGQAWINSIKSGFETPGWLSTAKEAGLALVGKVRGIANSIMGAINAFKSTVISPIIGVISNITKVVKSIVGDIVGIIQGVIGSIVGLIRSVGDIARSAIALVQAIEGGIADLVGLPGQLASSALSELTRTLNAYKKMAGVIVAAPKSISDIMKSAFATGRFKGNLSMFGKGSYVGANPSGGSSLGSSGSSKDVGALLNSGKKYTPSKGASL